jgi:hypothetical protein
VCYTESAYCSLSMFCVACLQFCVAHRPRPIGPRTLAYPSRNLSRAKTRVKRNNKPCPPRGHPAILGQVSGIAAPLRDRSARGAMVSATGGALYRVGTGAAVDRAPTSGRVHLSCRAWQARQTGKLAVSQGHLQTSRPASRSHPPPWRASPAGAPRREWCCPPAKRAVSAILRVLHEGRGRRLAPRPAITISPISLARTRRPWRGTVTPYAGAR